MKAIIEKMLECLLAFLPFLSKRSKKKVEKMKEFSELVREQYGFLVGQLEKVLQDYFGLSARVKEMHTEIFSLKAELAKALTCRCMRRIATGGWRWTTLRLCKDFALAGRPACRGGTFFCALWGQWLFLHRSMLCVPDEKKYICPYLYK